MAKLLTICIRIETGVSTFEMFSVEGDFDYTISTSVIESRKFHVQTYTNPTITECQIDVNPPAYTRLPNQVYNELKDFAVPEGSRVTFSIKTNLPVNAVFEAVKNDTINFRNTASLEYECEFHVHSNLDFVISLEDEKGHTGSTHRRYKIESIADFPPVIHTISPEENAVRKEDSEVSFSFKITDDYGLQSSKLILSISGRDRQQITLDESNAEEGVKDKMIAHSLKLAGKVEYGDVIAYFCTASDNAVPEANVGRSDIRFIEIRPDKPDPDESKSSGGKFKKLSVSDLIIEQKHLIRSTWDTSRSQDSENRNLMIQEIAKSASDLRIMSSRRLAELKGSDNDAMDEKTGDDDSPASVTSPKELNPGEPVVPVQVESENNEETGDDDSPVSVTSPNELNPGEPVVPVQVESETEDHLTSLESTSRASTVPDTSEGGLVEDLFRQAVNAAQQPVVTGRENLGVIGVLFEDAIKQMKRAEAFLKKSLTDESLPFQQQSLSKLVAIEIELEKNTPPSGEGEEGEDGGSEQQQEVAEQNQNKKKQELASLLEKMVKSLDKLAQRQDNMNEELSRNLEKKDKKYQEFIKRRQESIYEDTESLRTQLNEMAKSLFCLPGIK